LTFFKKAEDQPYGLFVQDKTGSQHLTREDDLENRNVAEVELIVAEEDLDEARQNESAFCVKKRRISVEDESSKDTMSEIVPKERSGSSATVGVNGRGPFLEASDSEEDDEEEKEELEKEHEREKEQERHAQPVVTSVMKTPVEAPPAPSLLKEETIQESDMATPLIKQETQEDPGVDFGEFESMEDFDEDLFDEGDEYRERRYMEEQAELECAELDAVGETDSKDSINPVDTPTEVPAKPCPICSIDLGQASEQDAAVHVNNCLDGNPTPLPEKKIKSEAVTTPRLNHSPSAEQYRKVVRPAKPGQASPFVLGEPTINGGSAFNKLMSGHAEDAAWAEAAARENASRGKPAYQRTCPFYKILPGLSICVDAFRYGAVAGCKAYFLSHFHSDHYIGLTATWNHGPIYCSKVTANLVRQQLRVDAHFVVPLEFEQTVDVPGTPGVKVTMISANHCPGSSLFLFEKVVGKKTNGQPRLQRILHCGDFRACKMHTEHPLLMPDIQNKLTGKSEEQKIDVCYLDTTYLNPKYAFPNQQAVIQACADMCVCLSKDTPDETDGWEQMKRQRAGEGMAKFVSKESQPEIKAEPADGEDAHDMKVEKNPHQSQQILSSIHEKKTRGRLLVVVGTYSIGKERICVGIAKALGSKIYAPASKQRIVAALEDPELDALMTNDPRQAQVHMTPLFEIRAETLDDYLRDFFPHFTRAVGFRPSGWNYRPPNTRFIESPPVQNVLHGENWKSTYSMRDLVPQRGSSSRASCFGVPYSEHSSFRELTMFCCALRIEKIIPTVNIGSQKSRERMKAWCERWMVERKKNGLYKWE
jgi:DNA cross-link repair 1A protein